MPSKEWKQFGLHHEASARFDFGLPTICRLPENR